MILTDKEDTSKIDIDPARVLLSLISKADVLYRTIWLLSKQTIKPKHSILINDQLFQATPEILRCCHTDRLFLKRFCLNTKITSGAILSTVRKMKFEVVLLWFQAYRCELRWQICQTDCCYPRERVRNIVSVSEGCSWMDEIAWREWEEGPFFQWKSSFDNIITSSTLLHSRVVLM